MGRRADKKTCSETDIQTRGDRKYRKTNWSLNFSLLVMLAGKYVK